MLRRRLTAAVTALAVAVLAPAPARAEPAVEDPQGSPAAKVAGEVDRDLAATGTATVLVTVAGEADLGAASSIAERSGRTSSVYRAKVDHAERTQRDVRRLLDARGATYTPFWIANVIEVTGDAALLREVAARPEVSRIDPVGHVMTAEPQRVAAAGASDVDLPWNLTQIGADRVWHDFGVRGEEIVVGSIDSGAQFDHQALVRQYRGNLGNGTFDHNYNWYDPSKVCGNPSLKPCDNNGHGTHTIGTMVGDDGAAAVPGVAPGAKWIAAKGCEARSCSDPALLKAGQWMLAPTDLNGRNPRPDLAPHVVNNSWGGPDEGNPWFDEMIDTWRAAGIFPVFAAGNDGENGCRTAGYPGSSLLAYGVGAYDSTGAIAAFSSRGPGRDGSTRPDIAAPGVNIPSAYPGGVYALMDGTSMAAPHVAGTIALLWSAVPNLRRDVETTRKLLDASATDAADLTCGGTPADNPVFGEGRLNAFDLIASAPSVGPDGVVATVTGAGAPLEGVKVALRGERVTRGGRTDAAGRVELGRVPAGDYTVVASLFGRVTARQNVTVGRDGAATLAFDLTATAPWQQVRGVVRDPAGRPVAGATVAAVEHPEVSAVTDAQGAFAIWLPEAEHALRVSYGRWLADRVVDVTVDGPENVEVALLAKTNPYGYTASVEPADWIGGGIELSSTAEPVALPFPVSFYAGTYRSVTVHTDGYLTFGPSADTDPAVYAFRDELKLDAKSSVRTRTVGSGTDRRFVVTWSRVLVKASGARVDIQAILGENGRITLQYKGLGTGAGAGGSALVGIGGGAAFGPLTYSADEPVLSDDVAVSFAIPGTGLLRGTVLDANDRQPVGGAIVAFSSGGPTSSVVADGTGFFQVRLAAGAAQLVAGHRGYGTLSRTLDVPAGALREEKLPLLAGTLKVAGSDVTMTVPAGKTRTRTVGLNNRGGMPTAWTAQEINAPVPPATEPGKVLQTMPVPAIERAGGVAYRNGELWIPDSFVWRRIGRYTLDGKLIGIGQTGFEAKLGDLAYVPGRDLMCGVNQTIEFRFPIQCFNPETLELVSTLDGDWGGDFNFGLAYRAADDTFYLADSSQQTILRIAGLSHPEPGAVLSSCKPAGVQEVRGLAYNADKHLLWANNQDVDPDKERIWALDPDTCAVQGSVADPDPADRSAAGMDLDPSGNIWLAGRRTALETGSVYRIDGATPAYSDVPWLTLGRNAGTVPADGHADLTLTVDTTGLAPGTYTAVVMVGNDTPRTPATPITITVVVGSRMT
ncbi:hypothetical protein Val02_50490 [Virgisporangium aliadipatigenens]|uniref:Peptidase S8/S53 domain-containing protein n=1 Tax=Virgisporangium aliadipatigenens TaxID=741659 RepID=A0A8J4DSR7_9ACTN|nr:S8 family serine peptidase [Virgisporangium aliadipatigenens]GIJ48163.1 hypothetical protein Val02_50490 [Virgisporangium aliadipatigenens]